VRPQDREGDAMKRDGWRWIEGTPTGKIVHEKEREARPVLYKPDGTPLVEAPREIGFTIPKGVPR